MESQRTYYFGKNGMLVCGAELFENLKFRVIAVCPLSTQRFRMEKSGGIVRKFSVFAEPTHTGRKKKKKRIMCTQRFFSLHL